MIVYQVLEEQRHIPELGDYTAFGIRAARDDRAAACPVRLIRDVFLRREQAECFCALLNRLRLDPIHLPDVVDDALADCTLPGRAAASA